MASQSAEADRTVVLLSGNSGVGAALLDFYLADGAQVIATHRAPDALATYDDDPRVETLRLDLNDPASLAAAGDALADRPWDLFVAANGTMEPIGPALEVDAHAWRASIAANALAPVELLQRMRPAARENAAVAFMAGGGTNNPFTNYSSYCLSKILLIKLCELLDDEEPDLKTFIIGPGYVKTPIHDQTLRAGARAGANREKTLAFLDGGDGTPLRDVYDCIEWCAAQPRDVIGGRNVSVVHDPWRDGGAALAAALRADPDMFKLRRAGNAAARALRGDA